MSCLWLINTQILRSHFRLKYKYGFSIYFCNITIELLYIDFIIFLKKITFPNQIITFLLSKQMGPIPILYNVDDKANNDIFSLINILGNQEYPLVINIWSQEAVKTLKTTRMNINNLDLKDTDLKSIHFLEKINIDSICF